jgi:hypothetical protein
VRDARAVEPQAAALAQRRGQLEPGRPVDGRGDAGGGEQLAVVLDLRPVAARSRHRGGEERSAEIAAIAESAGDAGVAHELGGTERVGQHERFVAAGGGERGDGGAVVRFARERSRRARKERQQWVERSFGE